MKTFRGAVRKADFAIAAEIYLRPETDAESVKAQARVLKDVVDGILLTDNQYGQLHMSTLVAASILLGIGVDPIVQITSRSRNRIALISDLLGASALGVTSLLLGAGERAPKGFKPRPKPVLDLSATELIQMATLMKSDERFDKPPDFFVGGLVTPVAPGKQWKPAKLQEKIDAGAQFVQTHICMNVDVLRRYMQRLVRDKLIQKTSVIAAVAVLESADDARWLKDNRPNILIPPGMIERLARARDPKEEGILVCAEVINALTEIPGIAGVNIMASRDLASIPQAIRAAGLER